ncbi:MAG: S8 family serine peptidase, partial [Proteiniphilum sp.]|nr:S8 family serine peptidase [Proteiniphilum sp.]
MRYFYSALLLLFSVVCFGQVATQPLLYRFRVYLSDKGESGYSPDEPERFLSERAIERKIRQNVLVDASDFPISPNYFTLVEKTGAKVVTHSKWLKTLTVEVADSLKINQIISLPFVDSVRYVWRGNGRSYRNSIRPRLEKIDCAEKIPSDSLFGFADKQYKIHNADKLALAGFRGKGIAVGVIDAGFTNFDVIPYFASVRLRGWMNFVPAGDMFSSSDHGTKVLSTMATNQPGLLLGSASEADYWLLRSEDVTSEFPVEEDYWVRAVECADSLGVDVINSSLGYNHFDDKLLNYTHADLTGNVSIMSIAADIAYEKGMLVVVSAGNEGNKPWRKLTPPGDAKNVIAVGAVGADSLIASFSSHGFTADGRIKPDLVSVGSGTITIGQDGLI